MSSWHITSSWQVVLFSAGSVVPPSLLQVPWYVLMTFLPSSPLLRVVLGCKRVHGSYKITRRVKHRLISNGLVVSKFDSRNHTPPLKLGLNGSTVNAVGRGWSAWGELSGKWVEWIALPNKACAQTPPSLSLLDPRRTSPYVSWCIKNVRPKKWLALTEKTALYMMMFILSNGALISVGWHQRLLMRAWSLTAKGSLSLA